VKLLLWAFILFLPLTILRADEMGCCNTGSAPQVTHKVDFSPKDQKVPNGICHQCHSGDCQAALCCCSPSPRWPTLPGSRELVTVPRPLASEQSSPIKDSESLTKKWGMWSSPNRGLTELNHFSKLPSSAEHPRFLLLQILRT